MTCPTCGPDGCKCQPEQIVADSLVDTQVEVTLTEDEDRRQRVIETAAPYFNYDEMPQVRELLEFLSALEAWLKDGKIPPKPEDKKKTKLRIIGDDDVPPGGRG
jgi:hypothetical protein